MDDVAAARAPTEMELRVATAICSPYHDSTACVLDCACRSVRLDEARAAIRAMSLPNVAMAMAGDTALEQNCDHGGPLANAELAVWKAMIDAASPPTDQARAAAPTTLPIRGENADA